MSRTGACLLIALAVASMEGCGPSGAPPGGSGNPAEGRTEVTRQQCGACHEIPGVQQASGLVGPPLEHFGRRTMIAGLLPNTPDNLVRWLRNPQAITPGNAMPDVGLTDRQARDIAAYLDTLQ